MKARKYRADIMPAFLLLLIEILYFIFGVNTRNVFELYLLQTASITFQAMLTRVLLLLLNISFVYFILTEKTSNIKDDYFNYGKFVLHIIVLRLLIDIVSILAVCTVFSFVIQILLNTIYIIFLFIIAEQHISNKKSIPKFDKRQIISAGVVFIIMVMYIIFRFRYNNQITTEANYLTNRFNTDIPDILFTNRDFNNDIITALYYLIISIILFYFSSKRSVIKCNNTISITFARSFLSLLLCVFLIIIKSWFFPYGIISRISINKNDVVTYGNKKEYNINHIECNIYRVSTDGIEQKCYSNYKVILMYGNNEISRFDRFIMNEKDDFIEIQDDIYVYNTQAVLFIENNHPMVFLTKDISSLEQNDKLTEVLEIVLELGRFDDLEYSFDYMYKYSPESLKEVLKRYSCEDYIDNNKNIDSEYIREFVSYALEKLS